MNLLKKVDGYKFLSGVILSGLFYFSKKYGITIAPEDMPILIQNTLEGLSYILMGIGFLHKVYKYFKR